MQLFVYGTLKKGMRAHHMMDGAKFIGDALIKGSLYNGGFPCLKQEGSTVVHGELYQVDDAVVSRCDSYEGHPDLFKRTSTKCWLTHATDGSLIEERAFDCMTYVYQGSVEGRPLVAGGKWE